MLKTLVLLISLTTFLIADARAATENKHTFVIIHGATGGAWDWKEVAGVLEEQGHTAYRATLTGLGERAHLFNESINLTTHINDVVNLIVFEQLHDVVLVGHSYGGMVITGVMDSIPDRIQHATYLDASAPKHGQSALDLWGGLDTEHTVKNGAVHFAWLDPKANPPMDVPHPLASLKEKVNFSNPDAKLINASFVAFVPEAMSKESRTDDPSWKNAQSRGWSLHTFAGDHVVYRVQPEAIAALIARTTLDENNKTE